MEGYRFLLAAPEDKARIVDFVNTHWEIRHPLVNRPDFFRFYYEAPGALRFALAETENGALAAVAGYIPASGRENADLWVSIWVADPAAKGSGLELMAALPKLTGCRTLACNNIRPKTHAFYQFLGYTTGRMGHFYRLGEKESYALAKVAKPCTLTVNGSAELRGIPGADALAKSDFIPPEDANPYKDMAYLQKRYFACPHQSYDVYTAHAPGEKKPFAMVATRTIAAGGTCVVRIADYVGEPARLPELGAALDKLMRGADAEYMDFYCAGIPADIMKQAGFCEREEGSSDIIPNYLDPPVLENTDYYYFTSGPDGFVMCKADGDQDRPNLGVDD